MALIKESQQAKIYKSSYQEKISDMTTIGDFGSEVSNDIGFMVLPDITNSSELAKLIPYEDNKSVNWSTISPLHYVNISLINFFEEHKRDITKGAKGNRISKRCSNIMANLSKEANGSGVRLYAKIPRGKDVSTDINSKVLESMKISIRMSEDMETIIPCIAFDEEVLTTSLKNICTSYALKEVFNDMVKPIKLDLKGYSTFTESLLLMAKIKNMFLDIIDGHVETYPVDLNNFRESIETYISIYTKAKSLVGIQNLIDKKEYYTHYEYTIISSYSEKYIRYDKYSESDETPPFKVGSVDFYKKKKEKKEKEEEKEMVIVSSNVDEEEFKSKIEASLTSNKYEPIRIMDMGQDVSNLNIWVREVAIKLKKEMMDLGVEPHPSIKMTLGEKLPEEYFNEDNANANVSSNNNVPVGAVVQNGNMDIQQMANMMSNMGINLNNANGQTVGQAQNANMSEQPNINFV